MMGNWETFYFQWPWMLLLLLALPFLFRWYLTHQRLAWQRAFRFSYVSVMEHLERQPSLWKRLWMPLSMVLALVFLIISASRPTLMMKIPTRSVDIMMVMDISLSMMGEDLKPNRMRASRDSAVRFIESLPNDVRVGLEFFAGNTYVVSPPIRDHHKITAYLKSLKLEDLQPRTEIGSALQAALRTLQSPEEKSDQKKGHSGAPNGKKPPERVIVLMSDGDSREGYPWQQAALNAKEQNVRIYTVGIGSQEDTTITYQGQLLPVSFSETTLKEIARMAGGDYFRVFSEKDFPRVYQQVTDRTIDYEERPEDLASVFSILALMILLGGLIGSQLWIRKLPV